MNRLSWSPKFQFKKAVGRLFATQVLHKEVQAPKRVSHDQRLPYLSALFNKPGMRILEIGSRNVTGGANREAFRDAAYVGFDFYAGENVDLVGDAHKLSTYFAQGERFDLIISIAVFEHLHMPWIVAEEIQKLLKVGGHVFVETHFSYMAHERPWNFFQFSDFGLQALFNKGLGFEVVDAGMCNPINGVFSNRADPYLRGKIVRELYCHSAVFCKKTRDVNDFDWRQASLDDVVGDTRYPTRIARLG